jgi:uncharacterized membrane protein YidH (DUF202 family)
MLHVPHAGVRPVLEIGRILTSAGLVAAATGLVVFAMGAAFVEPRDYEMNLGIFLMVAGVLASIVGIFMYRQYSVDE